MKLKLKKKRENKEDGTGERNLKRENGIRSDDFGKSKPEIGVEAE